MQRDDSPRLRAVVATLRKISSPLPDAEEYVMVHHPAFRVGKKPFVIAGMQHDGEDATVAVNLGRDMQHQLLDDGRFSRTPYIGQHGWVTVLVDELRNGELEALVVDSFRRVANQKQLARMHGAKPPPTAPAPAKRAVGKARAATAAVPSAPASGRVPAKKKTARKR